MPSLVVIVFISSDRNAPNSQGKFILLTVKPDIQILNFFAFNFIKGNWRDPDFAQFRRIAMRWSNVRECCMGIRSVRLKELRRDDAYKATT